MVKNKLIYNGPDYYVAGSAQSDLEEGNQLSMESIYKTKEFTSLFVFTSIIILKINKKVFLILVVIVTNHHHHHQL